MGSGLKVCKNGYSLNFNLFQFAKMSRKTRLYDPGTLYHVILRGNGFQRIFQGIHKSPRAVKRTQPKNVFLNCKLASLTPFLIIFSERGSSLEVWNFKQRFESEGFPNYLGGSGIDSFSCWMNPINPLSSNHPSPKPLFPNSQA